MAAVQPLPSLVIKVGLRFVRYAKIAFIGQIIWSVAPTYTLEPCLKVSVFGFFRVNRNILGTFLLSIATFFRDKWEEGS